MTIETRLGLMEEGDLVKRNDRWEDDETLIEAVEYCTRDCTGNAHTTGVAQGDGSFCEQHVHRSVHVTAKRWPIEATGALASLA